MKLKPTGTRRYVRAAYTATLAAAMGIAVAAGAPGIANASRVPAITTTHSGTWAITYPFNKTQSNPKFKTHSTVSGCITWNLDSSGTYGWHMKIIWYDGGKNKVLWASKKISSGVTKRCSPKLKVPVHDSQVYSQEILNCNNPIPLPCQVDGTWSLVTN
jgi:hypothetical protein